MSTRSLSLNSPLAFEKVAIRINFDITFHAHLLSALVKRLGLAPHPPQQIIETMAASKNEADDKAEKVMVPRRKLQSVPDLLANGTNEEGEIEYYALLIFDASNVTSYIVSSEYRSINTRVMGYQDSVDGLFAHSILSII
jgi:hypothetical protein